MDIFATKLIQIQSILLFCKASFVLLEGVNFWSSHQLPLLFLRTSYMCMRPSTTKAIIHYNSTIMIYPSREGTTDSSGSIFWELLHVWMQFDSIDVGYLFSALCVRGRVSLETDVVLRWGRCVSLRSANGLLWHPIIHAITIAALGNFPCLSSPLSLSETPHFLRRTVPSVFFSLNLFL